MQLAIKIHNGKVFRLLATIQSKNMNLKNAHYCFIILLLVTNAGTAQQPLITKSSRDTVLSAGAEYNTSNFHRFFWGQNYRNDWAVPVRVPVVNLTTAMGGLKPTKMGGGNQTKSLQVENINGQTFTFRTVNKTLGKVLPKEFLGTFIEDLVNDKVSMSHPYGASIVPALAKSAGVFHTTPQYVFLPKQKALDTFINVFGNTMYLFEQKIDSDWENVPHLGGFKKFISTENVLEKMVEDNDNQVDQKAFVRTRLLDMFINDWDRHEKQWEWGEKKDGNETIYTAVPQDRDQAMFTNNGVMLRFLIGISGLSYFQPFKNDLSDVTKFNYEQRNLDRTFANEMSLQDWQNEALALQTALTDAVIDAAVKQMPPESFSVSGNKIAATLKARRDHIDEWATTYYKFIARDVDVIGSQKNEHFEVKRLDEKQTQVNIFKITKEGERKDKPFYSRTFSSDETKEVRLYGLSGSDRFTVDGDANGGVKLRLIGGIEKDSMNISGGRVQVYDNPGNEIKTSNGTRVHLSEDTAINSYRYSKFTYSKKGISPTIFFSNEDRLFVGLKYGLLTQRWRAKPFASRQAIQVNYSISQKGFSAFYDGLFPNALGKSDLVLHAMWDQIRWTNFFGLGNETNFDVKDIDYYRTRTEEWEATVGGRRNINKHTFRLNANFRQIDVLKDFDRFVGKLSNNPADELFKSKKFAGASFLYNYKNQNDPIVPTKGVEIFTNLSFLQNLENSERYVGRLNGDVQWYIPVVPKLSFAVRVGGETVTGTPEFYQYASLGGSQQMRAFRFGRYWGESAVFNSNELRFISDVKSYLYNGKAGLIGFYDNGRVWLPGDKSDLWHDGYGFGVFIAPFNKIAAEVTYGFSRDDRLIQLRLSRKF